LMNRPGEGEGSKKSRRTRLAWSCEAEEGGKGARLGSSAEISSASARHRTGPICLSTKMPFMARPFEGGVCAAFAQAGGRGSAGCRRS
jgi:hypothetical protein